MATTECIKSRCYSWSICEQSFKKKGQKPECDGDLSTGHYLDHSKFDIYG